MPRDAPQRKPAMITFRDDSEPEDSPVAQPHSSNNGFVERIVIEDLTNRTGSPGTVTSGAEQRCREAGVPELPPIATLEGPLSEMGSSPSPLPVSKSQQKKSGRENILPTRKSSRTRACK
jgi:hypothetical protein